MNRPEVTHCLNVSSRVAQGGEGGSLFRQQSAHILLLSLTSLETSGKLYQLSEPQFPHLKKGLVETSIPFCEDSMKGKNSKIANIYESFNMYQALCQALYMCKLIWLNEVMHIKCLAQEYRTGSDNDDDEEIDDDSLGQTSWTHPLTGSTEWLVWFQEGGGPGKKGRVQTGEGNGNTEKLGSA